MEFPYTRDLEYDRERNSNHDDNNFNPNLKEASDHKNRLRAIRTKYLAQPQISLTPKINVHSELCTTYSPTCTKSNFSFFKRDKDLPSFDSAIIPDQYNSSTYLIKERFENKGETSEETDSSGEKVYFASGTRCDKIGPLNISKLSDIETLLLPNDRDFPFENDKLSVILEKTESIYSTPSERSTVKERKSVKSLREQFETQKNPSSTPIIITSPESLKQEPTFLTEISPETGLTDNDDTLKSMKSFGYSSIKSPGIFISPDSLEQHRASSENYLFDSNDERPLTVTPIPNCSSSDSPKNKGKTRSSSVGNEKMLKETDASVISIKTSSDYNSETSINKEIIKLRKLPPKPSRIIQRQTLENAHQSCLNVSSSSKNLIPVVKNSPIKQSRESIHDSRSNSAYLSDDFGMNDDEIDSNRSDSEPENEFVESKSSSDNERKFLQSGPQKPLRRHSTKKSVKRNKILKTSRLSSPPETLDKISDFQRTSFIDQVRRLTQKRDFNGQIHGSTIKLLTDILKNDDELAWDVNKNLNQRYPNDIRNILGPIKEKLCKTNQLIEKISPRRNQNESELIKHPTSRRSSSQNFSSRKSSFHHGNADVTKAISSPPPMGIPPPPSPPERSKSQIMPEETRLVQLDAQAIQISNSFEFITFSDLIKALTNGCTNDVEICRTLYRWVTHRNFQMLDFNRSSSMTDLEIYQYNVGKGLASRNELFYELCRYAGIYCQYIVGISKGAGYRPGMSLSSPNQGYLDEKLNQPPSSSVGGLFSNTWLAVHVGGNWRFINCNWGSRWSYTTSNSSRKSSTMNGMKKCLVNSKDSWDDSFNSTESSIVLRKKSFQSDSVGNRCDEFYFLTDPDQHIFEHFPDKKKWQLLAKPIKLDKFSSLPLLKSPFFNTKLRLYKKYNHILFTNKGKVSLKIHLAKFVGLSCTLENASDGNIIKGLTMIEYCHDNTHGTIANITTMPSQPGNYYLNVYVAEDWRFENQRELACCFMINCNENNYSRLVIVGRLPDVGFLGATPLANVYSVSMASYGLACKGRPYIVFNGFKTTPNITLGSSDSLASIKIPFIIAPGLKLSHQLKSFDRPGLQMADCDNYALLQMFSPTKSSKYNAYYNLRIPVPAFYYLTIYASFASDPNADHLECVYRLLIDARKTTPPTTLNQHLKKSFVSPFPRQTYWFVYCNLIQPTIQALTLNKRYTFRLDARNFTALAVVINQTEWHYLSPVANRQGRWFGKINVGSKLGDLSIYGKLLKSPNILELPTPSDDRQHHSTDNAFVKLIDYVIVP